ncbi:hypothetical protein ABK040_003385 [Willaertia magna]
MTTTEVDYSIHSSKLLKYQIVGYLGEGSYARVYKVRNDAWKYYALKAINPDMFEDFDKLEETYKRMKEFSEKYPDAPVVKVIEYDKTTTDLYNTFIEVVLHPVTDYSLSLIQEEVTFIV